MTGPDDRATTPEPFSLRRWSRRKLESARTVGGTPEHPEAPDPDRRPDEPRALAPGRPGADPAGGQASSVPGALHREAGVTGTGAGAPTASRAQGGVAGSAASPAAARLAGGTEAAGVPGAAGTESGLPPVESLTLDSDFAAFMQPRVDESLRRAALKQLFRDPRFNVMDGLDVYIDDYSRFEALSPEMARTLVHAKHLFDPPKVVVNEEGYAVEAVTVEESAADAAGADGIDAELPAANAAGEPIEPALAVASRPARRDTAEGTDGTEAAGRALGAEGARVAEGARGTQGTKVAGSGKP